MIVHWFLRNHEIRVKFNQAVPWIVARPTWIWTDHQPKAWMSYTLYTRARHERLKPNFWNQGLTSTQQCLLLIFFTFFKKNSTFSRKRKASHQSVVDPCRIEIFRYGQNHTRGVDYFGLELEFNTDWAGGAEVDWFDLILVSRKSGSDVDVMSS